MTSDKVPVGAQQFVDNSSAVSVLDCWHYNESASPTICLAYERLHYSQRGSFQLLGILPQNQDQGSSQSKSSLD